VEFYHEGLEEQEIINLVKIMRFKILSSAIKIMELTFALGFIPCHPLIHPIIPKHSHHNPNQISQINLWKENSYEKHSNRVINRCLNRIEQKE